MSSSSRSRMGFSGQSGASPGQRHPESGQGHRQQGPRLPVRAGRVAVTVVVVTLAAVVAACSSSSASGSSSNDSVTQLQSQYESVVDHVLPSVVQITTNDSTGSGVVYDSSGDIVTNAHVVGTATSVTVREPADNKQLTASVVGTFPPTTSR